MAWWRKPSAQIAQGVSPWQQSWTPGARRLPEHLVSGHAYRGVPALHLSVAHTAKGYRDNRRATATEIQALGGQVRPGEQDHAGWPACNIAPPPGPSIDDSGRRVAQGFVEGVSVTPRTYAPSSTRSRRRRRRRSQARHPHPSNRRTQSTNSKGSENSMRRVCSPPRNSRRRKRRSWLASDPSTAESAPPRIVLLRPIGNTSRILTSARWVRQDINDLRGEDHSPTARRRGRIVSPGCTHGARPGRCSSRGRRC